MEPTFSHIGSTAVLTPTGDLLDLHYAHDFEDQFHPLVQAHTQVVPDLCQVDYLSIRYAGFFERPLE
jgi:hypothetical protein